MNIKAMTSAILVATALVAQAADKLIPYNSEKMKAYAPTTNAEQTRGATFAIDGSGLEMTDGGVSHASTPDKKMWMSNNNRPGWFLVDLGEVYGLSRIHVWNYNHANYAYRGVKTVDIYVSTADSVPTTSFDPKDSSAGWSLAQSDVTLNQAGGTEPYYGEDVVLFKTVRARWVALKITGYYNEKEKYAGMSEIQFYEEGFSATFSRCYSDVKESTRTSAVVRGTLHLPTSVEGQVMVGVVWGEEAGGPTVESWSFSRELGNKDAGPFQATIAEHVEENTVYQFAFYAINPDGTYSFSESSTFATYESENCIWTGEGADRDWSNGENWSTGLAPKFVDTVTFPAAVADAIAVTGDVEVVSIDLGASSVNLAGSGSITTSAIKLGSSEGETPLENTISVAIIPMGAGGGEVFTFDIGTNRVLKSAGAIVASEDDQLSIRKIGAGTLSRTVAVTMGTDNPFAGEWLVEEGEINTKTKGAVRGTFKIGGKGVPAVMQMSEDGFSNGSVAEVFDMGELRTGKISINGSAFRLDPLTVHEGGLVQTSKSLVFKNLALYGGVVRGEGSSAVLSRGGTSNDATLRSLASDVMSVVDVPITSGNSYSWYLKAARGKVPVDLLVKKDLQNGHADGCVYVCGGGVVRLEAAMSSLKYRLMVGDTANKSKVTCYVDGSTMATGKNTTYLRYASTLAGVGTLANTSDVAFKVDGTAITINDDGKTPDGTICTIAPGSIDMETGEHVFGTMTVGAEGLSRNVQFYKNGRILCQLGPSRHWDKLMIYGKIVIAGAATNNSVELVVPEDMENVRGGRYVLVEATEGIVDAEGKAVDDPFTLVGASKKVKFGVEKNGSGAITKIYADVQANGLMLFVR